MTSKKSETQRMWEQSGGFQSCGKREMRAVGQREQTFSYMVTTVGNH